MNYLQKKKRALISMHQSFIPSGYKQVEYLESTQTSKLVGQYIDTNILSQGKLGVEIKAQIIKTYDNRCFWLGGENSWASGTSFNIQSGIAGYGFVYFDAKSPCKPSMYSSILDNTIYTLRIRNGSVELTNNSSNTTSNYSYIVKDFISNSNIYLFGICRNKSLARLDDVRIYSCKMYIDDVLVRDFIPCLDNNNRPCMYDTVSKKTYYNQGTGEFLYGEVINS